MMVKSEMSVYSSTHIMTNDTDSITIYGTYKLLFSIHNPGKKELPGVQFTYTKGFSRKTEHEEENKRSTEEKNSAAVEIAAEYGFSKISSVSVKASYQYSNTKSSESSSSTLDANEVSTSAQIVVPTPTLKPDESFFLYVPALIEADFDIQFGNLIESDEPINLSASQAEITIFGQKIFDFVNRNFSIQSLNDINKVLYFYPGAANIYAGADHVLYHQPPDTNCDWRVQKSDTYRGCYYIIHCATGATLTYEADKICYKPLTQINDTEHSRDSVWKIYPAPDVQGGFIIQHLLTSKVLTYYDAKMGVYAGDPWVIGKAKENKNSSEWRFLAR